MEPKLITNETLIKKIEAGPREFIFTDKRLIIQNTGGQDSRYSSYDNISRPVITTQEFTDPIGPKIKVFTPLIWIAFLIGDAVFSEDTNKAVANWLIMFVVSAPFAWLLGLVLALVLKKKSKEVLLFQLLMKDGTMLINEYYEIQVKNSLTEIEYSIVEHTLN